MKPTTPRHKRVFIVSVRVLLLLCMMALSLSGTVGQAVPAAHAAGSAPDLGAAGTFAVLAGSTVTNTGATVVTGDVGVSPGSAVTGFPPGGMTIGTSGTIHTADAVAALAQTHVITASSSLAAQPCTVDITGQDLGGLTLTPGVYRFSSGAQLTGNLTLDAQGDANAVFIFQIGTTLTTASNSSVLGINGATPARIFWQVGSSATLGTGSAFEGRLLALTSITAISGASIQGSLYAHNGAVTLDTNHISVPVAPQTISFTGPSATSLSASPVTLSATASSGLGVLFTSLTASVCTVSGLNVSLLAIGTCTIEAAQAGNGTYDAATPVDRSFTVTQATTSTTLTAAPNPSVSGQPVTLTATITGVGIPVGTVNFDEGSIVLGTGTLNGSGVATFTTSALAVGSHALTAVYSGDVSNAGSVSPVDTITTTAPPAPPINPPAPPVVPTTAPTLVATDVPTTAPTDVPTTAPTRAATDVPTVAPSATPVVESSPTAAASDTAVPEQSAVPSASASPRPTSATVTINGAHFTLSVNTGTIAPGEPITLTATLAAFTSQPASLAVTILGTGASDRAGSSGQSRPANTIQSATSTTVSFRDGGTVLGSADLVHGAATLTTTKLGPGVHNITATLNGQTAAATAITPPVVVIAQKAGTVMPLLVLQNFMHTVVGGRTAVCNAKQNSSTSMQQGCELVTSDWLPGAKVTYTVTYANGTKQVLTGTAGAKGHAQGLFNVAYLPNPVAHGLARSSVLISAQAVLPDGTTAGTTTIRFAAQR